MHCVRSAQGNTWAAARSRHPGGVNASLCDGSVHFVAEKIDLLVYRALATRDNARFEPIPTLDSQ